MHFSFLVPTLGDRKDELNRLLQSLDRQEFKDFEVVIVSQANHEDVENIIEDWQELHIIHVKLNRKGLSYARNQGLPYCSGEWVILSDDDAWYPDNGLKELSNCISSGNYNIVLSRIYDSEKEELYKNYDSNEKVITNKFQLMSRSSIEIAFKRENIAAIFDEEFGLGAKYVCGEEIDFLLKNFKKGTIKYFPVTTVYHPKKEQKNTDNQLIAKGAIYAKHFGRFTAFLITVRDKLKKRRSNSKAFWQGYKDYKASLRRK